MQNEAEVDKKAFKQYINSLKYLVNIKENDDRLVVEISLKKRKKLKYNLFNKMNNSINENLLNNLFTNLNNGRSSTISELTNSYNQEVNISNLNNTNNISAVSEEGVGSINNNITQVSRSSVYKKMYLMNWKFKTTTMFRGYDKKHSMCIEKIFFDAIIRHNHYNYDLISFDESTFIAGFKNSKKVWINQSNEPFDCSRDTSATAKLRLTVSSKTNLFLSEIVTSRVADSGKTIEN